MERNLLIFLIAIFTSSGFWEKINAQISPTLDPNYVSIPVKSDEFSGTTLNSNLWNPFPAPNNCIGRGAWCDQNNVNVDNGYLRLKLTAPDPNYYPNLWRMGQMTSKNPDYSYGYFEISAKLVDPGYFNPSGQPILTGIWPSFWLYVIKLNNCFCYHDEIDVVDNLFGADMPPGVTASDDTKYLNGGTSMDYPRPCDPNNTNCTFLNGGYSFVNNNPLFEEEHRYGVEWLSNNIYYYLDGNLVGRDVISIPQDPMYVVMGMQFDRNYFDTSIPLPQEYEINYFRYYQLIKDYCDIDEFIHNNEQLQSFASAPGVRKSITISSLSSLYNPIYLNPGDIMTFRATENILINGDFYVPLGAELNVIPTPCN